VTQLKSDLSSTLPTDIPGTRLNDHAEAPRATRLAGYAGETQSGVEFLITIKADVVDARFAGLDTIHYLLKVLILDLQAVTDQ